MVGRIYRSPYDPINIEELRHDLNGIQFFLERRESERKEIVKILKQEIKKIYENKMRVLSEGNFAELEKLILNEMTMYSSFGIVQKTREMLEIHQQIAQLDVDIQRLKQLEYEYITSTTNRTTIMEIKNEL